MIAAVAPVRERHVIVDADEIDLRVGPERIEVEVDVAGAVVRVVPEIFRPVGGIADLRAGPEDAPAVGGEIAQLLDRRIAAGAGAHLREPAHLRADQEGVDAARRRAEMRVVQDHPPQAPVAGRAGPADGLARDVEVGRRGVAEERGDLRGRAGGLVRRAGEARRRRTGDPAAPGEDRLAGRRRHDPNRGSAACCRRRCPSARTDRRSRQSRAPSAPGSPAPPRNPPACRHRPARPRCAKPHRRPPATRH